MKTASGVAVNGNARRRRVRLSGSVANRHLRGAFRCPRADTASLSQQPVAKVEADNARRLEEAEVAKNAQPGATLQVPARN